MRTEQETWLYRKAYREGYRAGLEDGLAGKIPDDQQALRSLPLDCLMIPARSAMALSFYGCETVGDVAKLSYEQIYGIRGLGCVGASHVGKALWELGIRDTAWQQYILEKP